MLDANVTSGFGVVLGLDVVLRLVPAVRLGCDTNVNPMAVVCIGSAAAESENEYL